MSGDLIDTTEMYLKTVFELQEAGVAPMRARIAERLGHSGPTVSQTVARMERDGLLHLDDQRVIHLSDEGSAIATDVMRKHRLAERHLLDVIGLEYPLVHEEACRWEHVMSADVERRIAALIEPPYIDPYGNPIPGTEELGLGAERSSAGGKADGGAASGGAADGIVLLAQLLEAGDGDDEAVEVVLERIGERAQSDPELLRDLAAEGIVAGARMTVEPIGGDLRIVGRGAEQSDPGQGASGLVVPGDLAQQLTVRPLA